MGTELNLGNIVEAKITKITDFGAFVRINGQNPGLIHISQISSSFVKDINEHLKVGDKVKARIIKLGPGNKIDLSLKIKENGAPSGPRQKNRPFDSRPQKNKAGFKSSDFEEKLGNFLQQSQRSLTDLKKHNEKYHR